MAERVSSPCSVMVLSSVLVKSDIALVSTSWAVSDTMQIRQYHHR